MRKSKSTATKTTDQILKEQGATARADRENALTVKKENALVADNDNPWSEMSTELDRVLGLPRMKFSKEGAFMIGDSEEIAMGSKVIARVGDTEYGWKRWENSALTDMRWGRMADRFVPPVEGDLPNNEPITQPDGTSKKPWQFSMAVPFTLLGKDGSLGETFAFATPSKGGLNAMRGLTRAYGHRRDQGQPGEPICELGGDKYWHRTHNSWVHYPILRVVGWTGADGKPLSLKDDLNDDLPEGM
jgi:hypothetical protein